MKPVKFKQQNCTYAEHQPEYLPLPAHKSEDGVITVCWKLSFWERICVLITGRIFWRTITFNYPVQPQLPNVKEDK